MIIQYTPYAFLLLFAAITCGILGIYSFTRRQVSGSRAFTLLMMALMIWLLGSVLEYSAVDVETKFIATIIEYPGIVLVAVGWVIFVATYTGHDSYITGKKSWLLFVIPFLIVVFVITNPVHHLYYTSITTEMNNGLSYTVYQNGPLFWVHIFYSYLLIIIGIAILLGSLASAAIVFRRQILLIFLMCIFPFFVNILHIIGFGPMHALDLTPFVFIISSIGLLIGSVYYQFLTLAPIAHTLLIKNMRDALIVLDNHNRIIDANPSAEIHLPDQNFEYIGKKISDLLQLPPDLITRTDSDTHPSVQILKLPVTGSTRFFEIRCVPVNNNSGIQIGKLITIHDAHDRIIATQALNEANKKLQLLSGITRHDIKNQLNALMGYLYLAEEIDPEKFKETYLEKMNTITERIAEQIDFTADYQDIGLNEPKWQDLDSLMKLVTMQFHTDSVRFINELEGACIYADPMIERVLFNLFDNAIKYGEKISIIRSSYYTEKTDLVWIVEDNGIGVSYTEKETIFHKGYGNNTGLGLFLVREILSITGCTIKERGEPGKGAIFEIRVPDGQYKIVRI